MRVAAVPLVEEQPLERGWCTTLAMVTAFVLLTIICVQEYHLVEHYSLNRYRSFSQLDRTVLQPLSN